MNLSLIGMPLFYGCDRLGVEKGPEVLRQSNIKTIFEENHTVKDLGDIEVQAVDPSNKYLNNSKMKYLDQVIDANTKLANKVYESLQMNNLPFVIGGDHSLALGSLAGVSKYYNGDLAVIWIDAHGDINTHETSPTGNIHGMPLAASMGIGYEKLTQILTDNIKVKPENVFILACRDLDKGELDLIEKLDINVWNIDTIKSKSAKTVVEEVLALIEKKGISNIHLSYDIDCLDPEYVPGTGTPVDNGLTFDESSTILKGLFNTSLIRAIDFVEFNPEIDINSRTKETCVELIKLISTELK